MTLLRAKPTIRSGDEQPLSRKSKCKTDTPDAEIKRANEQFWRARFALFQRIFVADTVKNLSPEFTVTFRTIL